MIAKKTGVVGLLLSMLFATSIASAQEAAPAAAPAARPAPAPAAPAGNTDHDAVVGRFAVGFLGVTGVPIAPAPMMAPATIGIGPLGVPSVPAPVIGVRYWLQQGMGIDAGLGLGWFTATGGTPTPFAFVLHGGVPLALATYQHFTFLVVPELNFGYATESVPVAGGPSGTTSGWMLNLGARVGAEVQFGFIGIPQLALQGSVGLFFEHDNATVSPPAPGMSVSNGATYVTTSVQSNPWGIFTNSVTALYYF